METLLRNATDADADRIVSFWHDAGASMTPLDSVEHVRRLIAHPTARLLLAEAGTAIIGTLIGTFDGWRGNMYRLVVHPDRRREGIARQLVAQVELYFAQQGARRITVLVEADRPWAAEFWTAIGYPLDTHVVRHLGLLP